MAEELRLIVGLGNPGPDYALTRHNAGQWFIETLARDFNLTLKPEKKAFGLVAKGQIHHQEIKLLIPTTFMNQSGQAIAALSHFYKIPPQQMLIAHDELDFLPGQIRLKQNGGHGGHNGLRNTISSLGQKKTFHRLRIGIGHPGDARKVSQYVLKTTPKSEQLLIESAIDEAIRVLPDILSGQWQQAMNRLHTFKG